MAEQQTPRDGETPARDGDEVDEVHDDAADDALDETDVDPTGNVVHNDAVTRVESAVADQTDQDG